MCFTLRSFLSELSKNNLRRTAAVKKYGKPLLYHIMHRKNNAKTALLTKANDRTAKWSINHMDIQSRTIISPQKHQDIKIPFHPTLIKQKDSTSKGRILKKYRIRTGAEPALPIGESLVFSLRTAVTSLTACFGLTFTDLLIYCTNGFSLQVISKRALTFNTRVLSKSWCIASYTRWTFRFVEERSRCGKVSKRDEV